MIVYILITLTAMGQQAGGFNTLEKCTTALHRVHQAMVDEPDPKDWLSVQCVPIHLIQPADPEGEERS